MRKTDIIKMARMVVPGIFAGLLGGEIASFSGNEDFTWVFALVIGYSGTPALEMITQGILGIIRKAMDSVGVNTQEKITKNDTINIYENKHTSTTVSNNVLCDDNSVTIDTEQNSDVTVSADVVHDVVETELKDSLSPEYEK